jgi:hypothetical protein
VSKIPASKFYLAHTVAVVGLVLALPLWREFYEPKQAAWDVFLALFLGALVASTFFGIRHLQRSGVDIGEARFPSADGGAK